MLRDGLFTPPYAWEIEVYFDRWALDPDDMTDRRIASLLHDLSDRGGFGHVLDAIAHDDHEVHAEIVTAWRKILAPERT